MPRPVCQMPWCEVQVPPAQAYCAGHIYLTQVEERISVQFALKSQALLERIKLKIAEEL